MINLKHARRFCCEDISKIEGYQEAVENKDEIWDIHHRRETDEGISRRELKKRGEYFQRPAAELVFLKHREHTRLHNLGNRYMCGKHLSAETRKKMSKALSGEKHPNFGKHLSAATRKKLSQALLGRHHSTETCKKMSASRLGKCHSDKTRKKIAASKLGKHWYNNGVETVLAKTCPDGFVKGRICHRQNRSTLL